ncbi:hypothetical protein FGA82_03135 [Pseudomonas fluorescens]|nr:hypothetical protein FGA82_03135 [Pseudomonas fluorescens]
MADARLRQAGSDLTPICFSVGASLLANEITAVDLIDRGAAFASRPAPTGFDVLTNNPAEPISFSYSQKYTFLLPREAERDLSGKSPKHSLASQ